MLTVSPPCPILRQCVILVLSCFPMLTVSRPCPALSLCMISFFNCFPHADGVMAMSHSQLVCDMGFKLMLRVSWPCLPQRVRDIIFQLLYTCLWCHSNVPLSGSA